MPRYELTLPTNCPPEINRLINGITEESVVALIKLFWQLSSVISQRFTLDPLVGKVFNEVFTQSNLHNMSAVHSDFQLDGTINTSALPNIQRILSWIINASEPEIRALKRALIGANVSQETVFDRNNAQLRGRADLLLILMICEADDAASAIQFAKELNFFITSLSSPT